MKKPKKTKNQIDLKALFVVITATVLMLAAALFIWHKIDYYNRASDSANTVSIRELILLAAEGTKKDAPVDPKTGDVYFPQARLYVPNKSGMTKLTYEYYPEGKELSVSSHDVFNRASVGLYGGEDVEEVFEAVPKLQACQRGVKLLYQTTDDQALELKWTIELNNGKALYAYAETACPELEETVTLLKKLRAY